MKMTPDILEAVRELVAGFKEQGPCGHYPASIERLVQAVDASGTAGHEVKFECAACGELIIHMTGLQDVGFFAVARCPKCNEWGKLNLKRGTLTLALIDGGNCPDCGAPVGGVEYAHPSLDRYDGISEYVCMDEECGARFGRWSGKRLADGETEPRFGLRQAKCDYADKYKAIHPPKCGPCAKCLRKWKERNHGQEADTG